MQCGFVDTGGGGNNHKKKEDRTIEGMVFGTNGNQVNVRINHSLSNSTSTRTKVTPNSDDMNDPTRKSTDHSGVFTSGPYTTVPVDPNNYDLILSGPTLYAKVTSEPSRKSVNFHTLITPVRNGVDVVVPLESIRANREQNTWGKYGLVKSLLNSSTGLFSFQFSFMDGLDSMLDNAQWFIHNNMLILKKVEFGCELIERRCWSSYVRAMIKLQADVELKDTIVVAMPKLVDECPKNIGSDVAKNLKNHSQAPRGVLVGPKNVVSSSISTNPTADKIDKLEKLIIDGKILLVDDEGKPLKKVDYPGDHDSEDEVEAVYNEMASFLALERLALIIEICFWILDSGCSKHMTGNHALLSNFVKKILGAIRFGNNDFAVIVGYGDVVLGSATIHH
ncbi:hypothetical protein Tco_0517140 [Tanacetum coccineum]